MKKKLTIGLILISSSIQAMKGVRTIELGEKKRYRSGHIIFEDLSGKLLLFIPPPYENTGFHPLSDHKFYEEDLKEEQLAPSGKKVKEESVLAKSFRERGLVEKKHYRSGHIIFEDPSGKLLLFVPPVYEDAGLHPLSDHKDYEEDLKEEQLAPSGKKGRWSP